jgi:hypothetical protein
MTSFLFLSDISDCFIHNILPIPSYSRRLGEGVGKVVGEEAENARNLVVDFNKRQFLDYTKVAAKNMGNIGHPSL